MKKIAILGTGPLPIEKDSYIYSSSNRTWQIAKGLVDAGHRVHVISFRPTRTEKGVRINDSELRTCREGDLTLDSVEELTHFRSDSFLKERITTFQPDALVGVNAFPAGRAAALDLPYPLWADMNGFNMGEVQIRARITGNDNAISQGWDHESGALCKADVFSAASSRQRYALIGQLAAIGRLRSATCGYEFVHVVPNGREDLPPAPVECRLRKALGTEAFLALWIGCYNFQFDLDTLFEGMETAMRNCPHLHFVSTGGQVDGHNETTYARFRERVEASPFRDRFHFEGWLAWEDFDALMRGCDVGVSLDIPCYETELGARNRLTEMMRVGLPAITTPGPEIAEDIRRCEAGWQSPPGSVEAFAEKILEAAASREECRRRGENSRRVFLDRYTISASTAPLLAWAENPWTAPDRGLRPLLLHDTQDRPAGAKLSWGSRFLNLFKVPLFLFLFVFSCLPSFAENLAPTPIPLPWLCPRAKLTGGYEQSIARVDEHAGRVLTETAMRIVEEKIHGTE